MFGMRKPVKGINLVATINSSRPDSQVANSWLSKIADYIFNRRFGLASFFLLLLTASTQEHHQFHELYSA
jgi:hypothetical protein